MSGFQRLRDMLKLRHPEFCKLLWDTTQQAILGSYKIWCSRNNTFAWTLFSVCVHMFSYVCYIYSSVCGQGPSYHCTAPLYGPMAICSWITLSSLSCTHVCEQHNEEFMMMRMSMCVCVCVWKVFQLRRVAASWSHLYCDQSGGKLPIWKWRQSYLRYWQFLAGL